MATLIIVTVIIPARNEQNFIAKCLDSVLAQDYPKENLEVLVVDGLSVDKTREIVARYCQKYPFIKRLDNPKKFSPSAFNIGITAAKGDYIIIMGAHAEYQENYISRCVAHIEESGADDVGGVWKIKPQKNTLANKAIAFASSYYLGAGDADYRRGIAKNPKEVDTVFGGCYKKEIFEKIGLYNENLFRSQDMDLNMRLKRAGGKIMLFPDIIVNYYPKSNFRDFLVHNFWDGVWAVYPIRFIKMPLKPRHYVPLLFVLALAVLTLALLFTHYSFFALIAAMSFYLAVLLLVSAHIAINEKEWRYLFLMPAAFAIRHFGYGIGSFYGIIKLLMPIKNGGKN
jgi:glycosyltransferase involved in cell wall biosynthesis